MLLVARCWLLAAFACGAVGFSPPGAGDACPECLGGLRAHRSTESAGNFDFQHYEPVAVGSYAPNDLGIYDLVGNGWEWTSTPFAPYAGFQPMASYPEYSADFCDGDHFVMKGASPATARELLRPTFRNWFRPRYPYVYATFHLVRSGS